MVDLEDKACFTKVCPRCAGARDTSSGSITGKVTSAPGPDELTEALFKRPIPADEIQWRHSLGTGAAARASTDRPRSRGESYSDYSESAEKALPHKTGSGIGGSGVRRRIPLGVPGTEGVFGRVRDLPQEHENTESRGMVEQRAHCRG